MGSGGNSGGIGKGKWKQRGLIFEKEFKAPVFPERITVESHRNWMRDLGRYIEMHVDYPGAEHPF